MQPEARDPVCVIDMLSAARGVVRSLQGVSLAKYQSDQDLRHAVERKIEIMGEAARRLSDGLREKNSGDTIRISARCPAGKHRGL